MPSGRPHVRALARVGRADDRVGQPRSRPGDRTLARHLILVLSVTLVAIVVAACGGGGRTGGADTGTATAEPPTLVPAIGGTVALDAYLLNTAVNAALLQSAGMPAGWTEQPTLAATATARGATPAAGRTPAGGLTYLSAFCAIGKNDLRPVAQKMATYVGSGDSPGALVNCVRVYQKDVAQGLLRKPWLPAEGLDIPGGQGKVAVHLSPLPFPSLGDLSAAAQMTMDLPLLGKTTVNVVGIARGDAVSLIFDLAFASANADPGRTEQFARQADDRLATLASMLSSLRSSLEQAALTLDDLPSGWTNSPPDDRAAAVLPCNHSYTAEWQLGVDQLFADDATGAYLRYMVAAFPTESQAQLAEQALGTATQNCGEWMVTDSAGVQRQWRNVPLDGPPEAVSLGGVAMTAPIGPGHDLHTTLVRIRRGPLVAEVRIIEDPTRGVDPQLAQQFVQAADGKLAALAETWQ